MLNEFNVIITGLCPGQNTIDIIDQFDCSPEIIDFLITIPNQFELNIVPTDVSCPDFSDGTINIDYTGGVPPYYFSWTAVDFIPSSDKENS